VIKRQAGLLTANKIKCKNKRSTSHNNNHGHGGFGLKIQKMLHILALVGVAVSPDRISAHSLFRRSILLQSPSRK
jgi:hypothetical protein